MLVLTRKQSETIQIGDSITITVLRMKGKSVRIGIQAPHELNVIRGELAYEQPADKNATAEVEDTEPLASFALPKPRVHSPRQDKSWATPAAPAAAKVGCTAAWSV